MVREVDEADFVYFTFLQAALDEVDRYDPMLERARARSLPFICSNPDRVAVNAGGLTAAPGSVAARYAAMGGEVVYVGKPHRPIYAACLDVLEELEPAEIVCIGDSTEHDIKGANDMNLAACFVECGIHAEHFPEGASRAGKVHALDLLCAEHECLPDYVIPRFRW